MEVASLKRIVGKEINKLRGLESLDSALDELSKSEEMALAAESRARVAKAALEKDTEALAGLKVEAESRKQSYMQEYEQDMKQLAAKREDAAQAVAYLKNELSSLESSYIKADQKYKLSHADLLKALGSEEIAARKSLESMQAAHAAFRAKYVNGA